MRDDTTVGHGLLASSKPLEQRDTGLHSFVDGDIDQHGARQAVLGDQDWLAVTPGLRDEIGRLALQGGDELGSHAVILKYPRWCANADCPVRAEWTCGADLVGPSPLASAPASPPLKLRTERSAG